MSGVIYQITCNTTTMKYIGQATKYKYKHDKPYNYGALGRWSDHVCSSKTRDTPLAIAIRTYGKNAFEIKVLEELEVDQLDNREAYWIQKQNTVFPNGLNVAKHARNRHREESNLHIFYQGKVDKASIAPIKKDGELRLVYVYLQKNDGTQERIAFGQKDGNTYEDALEEATEFLNNLECPYEKVTYNSDDLSEKYASKLKEFENKKITSVRITTASNLIAVYIGTSEMKLSKEHNRVCFGGKNITKEKAYNIAKEFISCLQVESDIIKDSIKSSQQAAAS